MRLPASPEPSTPRPRTVLLYTRTAGYRHDSIPAAVQALRELTDSLGLDLVASEDPEVFGDTALADAVAVVFLSTTGEVLTDRGRRALERFHRGGGGFLGIHSAAGTEYDWPYYLELVGARFQGHPEPQPATVAVTDRDHPATAHLSGRWSWDDEWYEFRSDPRGTDVPAPGFRVLAGVDETTYQGGCTGADHPLVWCRDPDDGAGRTFYTALGHHISAYADRDFREHLLGALRWVCAERKS